MMDEIEAKALALVNAHAINRRSDLDDAKHTELRCALLDAVQAQAATEARHAAELREQAERFSEVAARMVAMAEEDCSSLWAGVTRQILAPFILPAPDPLVEAIAAALREASPFADDGHDYTAEAKVAAAAVRAHQKDTNA